MYRMGCYRENAILIQGFRFNCLNMKQQLSPKNFRHSSPARISGLMTIDYRLQQARNRVNYLKRLDDHENAKIGSTLHIIKELQTQPSPLHKLRHAVLKEFNPQVDAKEKSQASISTRRNSTATSTSRLSILKSTRQESASNVRELRRNSLLDIEYQNQQYLQAKHQRCVSVKASREQSLMRARMYQEEKIQKVKQETQEEVKTEIEKYALREKMYSVMKRMEARLNESLFLAKEIYQSQNQN